MQDLEDWLSFERLLTPALDLVRRGKTAVVSAGVHPQRLQLDEGHEVQVSVVIYSSRFSFENSLIWFPAHSRVISYYANSAKALSGPGE